MAVADYVRDLAEHRHGPGDAHLDRRLSQLPDGHPSSVTYADAPSRPDRADPPERADRSRRPDRADRHEQLERPGHPRPYEPDRPRGESSDLSEPADDIRPLTDAEHAEHVADVRHRLADARAAGLETDRLYTIDSGREVWTDERDSAHQEIIDYLYAAASEVPCEGKAILAGGLPGAGKTTVLREHAGIDLSSYLMINPDDIKEEMARRGLIPEIPGLSPMESAGLVHEEASHIAKRLARRAEGEGRNVIWDVTLSKPDSAEKRVNSLHSRGYTQVDGVFIDIPTELSVKRADARYRAEHDLYRADGGQGGRFMSSEIICAQADQVWGSRNRANFEAVKDQFDSWSLFDNSVEGGAARLMASGCRDRHDREEGVLGNGGR